MALSETLAKMYVRLTSSGPRSSPGAPRAERYSLLACIVYQIFPLSRLDELLNL